VSATGLAGHGDDNPMREDRAFVATFMPSPEVPVAMWNPFRSTAAAINFFGSGIVTVQGERAAILICYVRHFVWPVLTFLCISHQHLGPTKTASLYSGIRKNISGSETSQTLDDSPAHLTSSANSPWMNPLFPRRISEHAAACCARRPSTPA